MRKLAVVLLALMTGVATGSTPIEEPAATIADLAWVAGCWDGSKGQRLYHEQWMRPAGDGMMGVSRTVQAGELVAYEFMQFREKDGTVYFISKPSGQPEAEFRLVKKSANEAVFENPEHDFPQRVIYKLSEDGTLAAAIEGTRNGKTSRSEFPMRRVECD